MLVHEELALLTLAEHLGLSFQPPFMEMVDKEAAAVQRGVLEALEVAGTLITQAELGKVALIF
jgi:hypothetical protein